MLFFLEEDKERNQWKLGFKRCKNIIPESPRHRQLHIMTTSITGSRDFTVAFT